jgi:hypothetical protein
MANLTTPLRIVNSQPATHHVPQVQSVQCNPLAAALD